jgi:hypothetical protein
MFLSVDEEVDFRSFRFGEQMHAETCQLEHKSEALVALASLLNY